MGTGGRQVPSDEDNKRADAGAPRGTSHYSRQDWIDAAREAVLDGGVAGLAVGRLAERLRVGRGSFYWHFSDRDDLLDALLTAWADETADPFVRVVTDGGGDALSQIVRYCEVWLFDKTFEPVFDSAIRDWARSTPRVAEIVRETDERRLNLLMGLLAQLGYESVEATVRARALYYHQVGYYTLGISQTLEERLDLFPIYFRVLVGVPLPPGSRAASWRKR